MELLDLPTEVLLIILELLIALDPITLLAVVPGVCRRLRALCDGVRGLGPPTKGSKGTGVPQNGSRLGGARSTAWEYRVHSV